MVRFTQRGLFLSTTPLKQLLYANVADGRGPVANPEGISFYNSLIDILLSRGIFLHTFDCNSRLDITSRKPVRGILEI